MHLRTLYTTVLPLLHWCVMAHWKRYRLNYRDPTF